MSLKSAGIVASPGGRRSVGKIAGGLLVAALLVAGAVVLWQSGNPDRYIATNEIIVVVLYVTLALFLVGFLLVFTGKLNEEKVGYMIVYCYLFTWFLLLAPPLVFIGFPEALDLARKVRDSPVGIVLGCAERPVGQQMDAERRSVPRDAAWLPKEIACGNNTPQWLLNIGGTVMPRGEIEGHRAAHEQSFRDIVRQNGEQSLKPRATGGEVQPIAHTQVPYDVLMWEGLLAMPPGETLKQTDRVLGGVVVPLYFVIISLMGGLVSMMRRVPEYQRRIVSTCPEHISCERAREYLVFQIMQVLSAPLIAITAYYAFEPTSRAASIALAFITGFSSELILLYVRAITVRLRPEESTAAARAPDMPAQVMLAPTSIEFGKVRIGAKSSASALTLTNAGTKPIAIREISVTAEFDFTPRAPMTLAGGAHLQLEMFFSPSEAGGRKGALTITSDAPGSPHVIALSGEGESAV
jgi:hypothetical protein